MKDKIIKVFITDNLISGGKDSEKLVYNKVKPEFSIPYETGPNQY